MYSVQADAVSMHTDSLYTQTSTIVEAQGQHIHRQVAAHQAGWHKGPLDNMYLASSSRDVTLNHKGLWRACGLYVYWPCRIRGVFDNLQCNNRNSAQCILMCV